MGDFPTSFFPPIFADFSLVLVADYSINETKLALKGMGSSKALGQDGCRWAFSNTFGTLQV